MYLAKFFSLPFTQVRFTANGRPSSRLLLAAYYINSVPGTDFTVHAGSTGGKDRRRYHILYSALLRRTAAVVRNRRDILDGADFDARGGKRADRGFAAGTRTADPYFHHRSEERRVGKESRNRWA